MDIALSHVYPFSAGNKPMRTMIGGHDSAVTCCRWSPDGKLIATGGADHVV